MTFFRIGFIVVSFIVLGACGDGEATQCKQLSDEALSMIRTACPSSSPTCGGNPTLGQPVVAFDKAMYDKLQQLKAAGCTLPDLGSAPVFCNSGSPECPDSYVCCATTHKCQRAC